MPLLDTPELVQGDGDHRCGPVAFNILFRFHYPRKPYPSWGELADPVRGLGPDTMELMVRKEFPYVSVGRLDLHSLCLWASFTPVLCVVKTDDPTIDHWVAVRSVTAHRVHVQDPDPNTRRCSFTHAAWLDLWTDSPELGYDRFGIAGWPEEKAK
jgi:hypothetical protein